MTIKVIVALVAVLALVPMGCHGPSDPQARDAAIRADLAAGRAPRAVKAIREVLDAGLAEGQDANLRIWLTGLVDAGHVDEARALFLEAARREDRLAAATFGVVDRHYGTNQMWQALAEWTALESSTNLPPMLRAQAFIWNFRSHMNLRQSSLAVARVREVLAAFDDEIALSVLRQLRDLVVAARDDEAVAALLREVGAPGAGTGELAGFRETVLLEVAIRDGDWDAAEQALVGVAAASEPLAGESLRRLLEALTSAGLVARAEAVNGRLAVAPVWPLTLRAQASGYWLSVSQQEGRHADTLSRLDALLDAGIPPAVMLSHYQNSLYPILDQENPEWTRMLLALGARLESQIQDADQRAALRVMQFDAAFVNEDYVTVLALLDGGLSGRDENWHSMARNKVLAHQAFKEGRLDDAVVRFRAFMEDMAKGNAEGAVDPTTGLRHSLDMTQGFNARRIGDLLVQMGRRDEARAAYGEAQTYFTQALQGLTAESREHAYVTNALAAIPQLAE
jgi:tetratricopeptide (TPR) repeat protein